MTDLKQLSALTALNDMMSSGRFSICTIDDVAKLLRVDPKGEAYDILRPLHCIHFGKMPAPLRDAIPDLIERCLTLAPTYQFGPPAAPAATVVNVTQERKSNILLRLLERT